MTQSIIAAEWGGRNQARGDYLYVAMLYNGVVRPTFRTDQRRMDLMYRGACGYARQMTPWPGISDCHGNPSTDEGPSTPEVEGSGAGGNPTASLDFGRAPRKDTNDEPSFVRTVRGFHRGSEPAVLE